MMFIRMGIPQIKNNRNAKTGSKQAKVEDKGKVAGKA
jgi:hypothetical protein